MKYHSSFSTFYFYLIIITITVIFSSLDNNPFTNTKNTGIFINAIKTPAKTIHTNINNPTNNPTNPILPTDKIHSILSNPFGKSLLDSISFQIKNKNFEDMKNTSKLILLKISTDVNKNKESIMVNYMEYTQDLNSKIKQIQEKLIDNTLQLNDVKYQAIHLSNIKNNAMSNIKTYKEQLGMNKNRDLIMEKKYKEMEKEFNETSDKYVVILETVNLIIKSIFDVKPISPNIDKIDLRVLVDKVYGDIMNSLCTTPNSTITNIKSLIKLSTADSLRYTITSLNKLRFSIEKYIKYNKINLIKIKDNHTRINHILLQDNEYLKLMIKRQEDNIIKYTRDLELVESKQESMIILVKSIQSELYDMKRNLSNEHDTYIVKELGINKQLDLITELRELIDTKMIFVHDYIVNK